MMAFSSLGAFLAAPLENRFPAPPEDMPAPDGIIVLGGAIDEMLSERRNRPVLIDSAAERLTAPLAREDGRHDRGPHGHHRRRAERLDPARGDEHRQEIEGGRQHRSQCLAMGGRPTALAMCRATIARRPARSGSSRARDRCASPRNRTETPPKWRLDTVSAVGYARLRVRADVRKRSV